MVVGERKKNKKIHRNVLNPTHTPWKEYKAAGVCVELIFFCCLYTKVSRVSETV